LLGLSCGTAIASVSALGLFQIERLLGGLWSVAAVMTAAILCWPLARAFARLSAVVPSGAGLLAYLSRGLGRRAALVLAVPYLLLTLALVGVEALIVGTMLARVLGGPPLAGALGLVAVTALVCGAGVRIGYRAQVASTVLLVAGTLALSAVVLVRQLAPDGGATGGISSSLLLPPAPDGWRFAAAVGQALFLFMGFELVTGQVEVARSPATVGRALGGSVAVLAAFYGVVSLGFSALPVAAAADPLVPQLDLARAAGGEPAALLATSLCLLASFTSLAGALLALSRFIYALGAQGILPRALARMEARRLVPRPALALLAAAAAGATLLVAATALAVPMILAAAAAAALAWAGALLARERPPFAEPGRTRALRGAGLALAAALAALGVGAVAGAGSGRGTVLGILAVTVAIAAAATVRAESARRRPRQGLPPASDIAGARIAARRPEGSRAA
jgi:amino acid transporter